MKDPVEFYQRKDGLWDWRLIGGNGEQMCESNQGYTQESDARRGFETCASVIWDLVEAGKV